MIGEKISPVLSEIEKALWEFEYNSGAKPEYTDDGFKAGIKIFISVLMDKMRDLQINENMDKETCLNMAQKAGEETRKLVKTYTNIDTHDLYDQN